MKPRARALGTAAPAPDTPRGRSSQGPGPEASRCHRTLALDVQLAISLLLGGAEEGHCGGPPDVIFQHEHTALTTIELGPVLPGLAKWALVGWPSLEALPRGRPNREHLSATLAIASTLEEQTDETESVVVPRGKLQRQPSRDAAEGRVGRVFVRVDALPQLGKQGANLGSWIPPTEWRELRDAGRGCHSGCFRRRRGNLEIGRRRRRGRRTRRSRGRGRERLRTRQRLPHGTRPQDETSEEPCAVNSTHRPTRASTRRSPTREHQTHRRAAASRD
jgi:hypothetical protein